jgi:formate transporter
MARFWVRVGRSDETSTKTVSARLSERVTARIGRESSEAPGEGRPPRQYLAAEVVLESMAEHGARRIRELSSLQVVALAGVGGGFIAVGALFAVLLASGVDAAGPRRLLEGLGFSGGFFFVILAEAVLFTEANVVMPATVVDRAVEAPRRRLVRFWALAWLGNFAGAFAVGWAVNLAQDYSPEVRSLLAELIAAKMSFREEGGVDAWLRVVLSGALANWLVGMAAFLAVMGRTIFGKYVPVFLAVTLFVAANFQHSPANMGFFSLAMPEGEGRGWGAALGWNIVPAGLGNIIGGTLLVVLPFWYALRPHERAEIARSSKEGSWGARPGVQ